MKPVCKAVESLTKANELVVIKLNEISKERGLRRYAH